MSDLLAELSRLFVLGPGSRHGPRHWLRVLRYGQLLAPRTGADPAVLERFALFHDCRREHESYDPDHGLRGAEQARSWQSRLDLDPRQLELLYEACRDHTDEIFHPDPTIGTCWDADRLDLDRVGIDELDLLQFSTEAGREWAELSAAERHRRAGLDPWP